MQKITLSFRHWCLLVCVVLALLAIFLPLMVQHPLRSQTIALSPESFLKTVSVSWSPSKAASVFSLPHNLIQEHEAEKTKPALAAWLLIVNDYGNIKQAQEQVTQLRAKGFHAFVKQQSLSSYAVAIGPDIDKKVLLSLRQHYFTKASLAPYEPLTG